MQDLLLEMEAAIHEAIQLFSPEKHENALNSMRRVIESGANKNFGGVFTGKNIHYSRLLFNELNLQKDHQWMVLPFYIESEDETLNLETQISLQNLPKKIKDHLIPIIFDESIFSPLYGHDETIEHMIAEKKAKLNPCMDCYFLFKLDKDQDFSILDEDLQPLTQLIMGNLVYQGGDRLTIRFNYLQHPGVAYIENKIQNENQRFIEAIDQELQESDSLETSINIYWGNTNFSEDNPEIKIMLNQKEFYFESQHYTSFNEIILDIIHALNECGVSNYQIQNLRQQDLMVQFSSHLSSEIH